tara:strand:+ start:1714 stop:2658 length:945 start_codon:yes stop_codon:yes gene_type:complete
MNEETLWVERYRPQKIEDCILPTEMKDTFQSFVDTETIPNLLLVGPAGCGKTTVAKAMLQEMDADFYYVNGSLEGRLIDTLRTEVSSYASAISFGGGRKHVIIDEADYLNPQSVQPALRGFIEEFSKNCGFIFTCNYVNRIIEPLHSRCSIVNFRLNKKDVPSMAAGFMKRVMAILEEEGIAYDKRVIAGVISKHFPDYRRVLNELQRYAAATGTIDTGILINIGDAKFDELIEALKDKEFTLARKWVSQNLDNDFQQLVSTLYEKAYDVLKGGSIPQLILILGEYQYKAAFVADQEINTMAMLVEIMSEIEFK